MDKLRPSVPTQFVYYITTVLITFLSFIYSVRIRRAVLDASLRSRSDFHTALTEFEQWIDRIDHTVAELHNGTNNIQSIKDSIKRKEWIDSEKVCII